MNYPQTKENRTYSLLQSVLNGGKYPVHGKRGYNLIDKRLVQPGGRVYTANSEFK